MDKYIYQCSNSIPQPLCDDIIALYETDDTRYKGSTVGGTDPTIKNTMDLVIPKDADKWKKVEAFLYRELNKHLVMYVDSINDSTQYKPEANNGHHGFMLKGINLQVDNFMIQKYDRRLGQYIYHNDFLAQYHAKRHRVITFLWYLNDVKEGGETEFWDSLLIKPEKGKLIMFPSFWCFPHRGKMPISDHKYIITGWFYSSDVN
jgi:hypothetical protein